MAEELADEDGCILGLSLDDEDCTPAFINKSMDAVRDFIAEFRQLESPSR